MFKFLRFFWNSKIKIFLILFFFIFLFFNVSVFLIFLNLEFFWFLIFFSKIKQQQKWNEIMGQAFLNKYIIANLLNFRTKKKNYMDKFIQVKGILGEPLPPPHTIRKKKLPHGFFSKSRKRRTGIKTNFYYSNQDCMDKYILFKPRAVNINSPESRPRRMTPTSDAI